MRRNLSSRTLVATFNRSQVTIGRASTPGPLCYCLFAPHIYGVVLRAHPVRGESHNQRNVNGEVATTVNLRNFEYHLEFAVLFQVVSSPKSISYDF